jgi:hypothetical protein
VALPGDVPGHAMYPFSMMAGLALSAVAMLVER